MQTVEYGSISGEMTLERCRQYAIFGALSNQAVEYLLTHGVIYSLKAKEALFGVGERSDRFYVVLQGRIAFYKCSGGNWAFMSDYNPGEQIGFVGMITLQPRVGWSYMETDGLVLEVSADLFYELQQRFPEDFSVLMLNLTREIGRSLIRLGDMLVEMTSGSQDKVV
jgi:CRP-like cAMP-binding protein